MNFISLIGILLSLILLNSCGDSNLPKYVELNTMRVLDLTASDGSGNAEFAAGDTVTISPLISDINNSGSLSYVASACMDPGVAYGSEPTCEGSSSLVNLASGSVTSVTSASNFTGVANTFTVTLPSSAIIFASRSSKEQYNGVSYLVTYQLNSSDGRQVKSFKRLIVSTKTTKNKNPVVSDVFSNGVSLSGITTLPLGGPVTLSLQFGSVGVESYSQMQADGSLKTGTEELSTTWFISDGSLKYYRTVNLATNEYTGPSAAVAGRKSFIITVTRDGRGGSTITKKEF